MTIFDFSAKDVSGNEVSINDFRGKVILIVNSATKCGFTPQYDELQDLYEKYRSKGLEILDFPCNQFGNQASESDEEIASFCDSRYGITFPHFAKIEVNGEHAHPMYQYLKSEKTFAGFAPEHPLASIIESILEREHPDYKETSDIKWNFTKFLIDRNGTVIARFEPTESMAVIENSVNELL